MGYDGHSNKRKESKYQSIKEQNQQIEQKKRIYKVIDPEYFSRQTEIEGYNKNGKPIGNDFRYIILEMSHSNNV